MPHKPPVHRPPGAPTLQQRRKALDQRRGSAASRGYDGRWAKCRKMFLRRNPLCVKCKAEGRDNGATVVDHIIPHKGDQRLFNDESNWQALCKRHHDVKTATEDGGFGK